MIELRLAVLIDADNVPYSHIKEMLEERLGLFFKINKEQQDLKHGAL